MDSIVKLKLFAILIALLIGVGLLVFFYFKIKKYFRFRLKDLKELGIFFEKRKRFTEPNSKAIREKVISTTIGIHQEKSNIVITKYNPAMAIPDFERLKPNLEHILGVKIEHISSQRSRFPWRQAKIILHTETFKNTLSMNECPKNLEPGQYWIGKTAIGDDLVLDLKRGDFS